MFSPELVNTAALLFAPAVSAILFKFSFPFKATGVDTLVEGQSWPTGRKNAKAKRRPDGKEVIVPSGAEALIKYENQSINKIQVQEFTVYDHRRKEPVNEHPGDTRVIIPGIYFGTLAEPDVEVEIMPGLSATYLRNDIESQV